MERFLWRLETAGTAWSDEKARKRVEKRGQEVPGGPSSEPCCVMASSPLSDLKTQDCFQDDAPYWPSKGDVILLFPHLEKDYLAPLFLRAIKVRYNPPRVSA